MSKRGRDLDVQKPQGDHREEMVSDVSFQMQGEMEGCGVGAGGPHGMRKERVQEEEGLAGEARE